MCIFGALVEFPAITPTMWTLLAAGALAWATAIVLVRRASH
jgi:predicted AlkP superfamily phosphohydrolase/phosphomutase